MLKQKELFAAVWSDCICHSDSKDVGYCDEWVETYPTLNEATAVCREWAAQAPGKDVRIFVARGLNLDGEYSNTIATIHAPNS